MRKHNHCVDPDSVSLNPQRARLQRNFNDFAHDANASAIPQWLTITPNVVNDAHDTDIEFGAAFLEYFLVTLLENPNFNDGRTMIVLTFDENDTDSINNRVYTLLLGGAIPSHLRGTTDSTFYTHYSLLSTVQANWKLGSLGRQDTNKCVLQVPSYSSVIILFIFRLERSPTSLVGWPTSLATKTKKSAAIKSLFLTPPVETPDH
jgi:hypothetical protein